MSKFVSIFLIAIGYLPISFRIKLGRSLAFIFSLAPTRDRKIAQLQIEKFLKKDSRQIIGQVYASLGQTAMETLRLVPILKNLDQYIQCSNTEILKKIKLEKQGAIALTAHTGNWDLLGAFFIENGLKIATIGRKARKQSFQFTLNRIRESYGIKTLWRDLGSDNSGKQIIRDIAQLLNQNYCVAGLIDQDTYVPGLQINFFGYPAKTPTALIQIAKKRAIPLIAAFNFRDASNKYKIFLHELDCSQNLEKILAEYNNLLENYIKQYPEQWVWFHKRWRTQSNGKRLSSKEYLKFLENL